MAPSRILQDMLTIKLLDLQPVQLRVCDLLLMSVSCGGGCLVDVWWCSVKSAW